MGGDLRGEDRSRTTRGAAVLAALSLGYIGIYLARKNLAVAIPLLQTDLGITKEGAGVIASAGTLAYAVGKVGLGPLVDRVGGRAGFLVSVAAVGLCSGLTGLAPSLAFLVAGYAANRAVAAGAWGAMLKFVPTWFTSRAAAMAVAVLSLSYVAGGFGATMFAREVVKHGGGYRAVFGAPAFAIALMLPLLFLLVRQGPLVVREDVKEAGATAKVPFFALFRNPTMVLGCALSFLVTLLREAFNTWSIDFLVQSNGGRAALEAAALQSVGFDVAGGLGIVVMAAAWTALGARRGTWLVVGSLVALGLAIASLPSVATRPLGATMLLAGVGFLVYGPFSLLGGLVALSAGGERAAASAAGFIDGIGYVASALAGVTLGRVLDLWGYRVGFFGLAGLAFLAAALASRLRLEDARPAP